MKLRKNRIFPISFGLIVAVLVLLLPALPAAAQDDGRLNPHPAEYYTIYCHHDLIDVYRGDGRLLNRLSLATALGVSPYGGTLNMGYGMTFSRNGNNVTISGSNGNLAPQPGSKSFSLTECIQRNGGSPIPVVPAPPVAPAPPGGSACTYIVQWGDTLFNISRRLGVSMASMISANNLVNPNRIYAGQRLIVPGCIPAQPAPPPAPPPTTPFPPGTRLHVLLPGQTLYQVSLWYNVNLQALININHIANPNNIPAGTMLIIP